MTFAQPFDYDYARLYTRAIPLEGVMTARGVAHVGRSLPRRVTFLEGAARGKETVDE
jgi:hypothetical protein